MLSEQQLSAAIGSTAYDRNGDKIGTVEHFFVDDRSGAPSWVAVTTGLFGTRHSIVPALDASFADGTLRVPVSKEAVKTAPEVDGTHLDPSDEAALRRHYGMEPGTGMTPGTPPMTDPGQQQGYQGGQQQTYQGTAPVAPVPVAAPTQELSAVGGNRGTPPVPAAPAQAPDDGAMTRSEERLRVGTERVATTRTRLVKYVVTEEVQITVPVRREEIRIEEVALDAPDDPQQESLLPAGQQQAGSYGTGGGTPATGGLPEEIILHTERPVVTMQVVPTERVRLSTELVQGQEHITGQVRREQIVVDQEGPGTRTTR